MDTAYVTRELLLRILKPISKNAHKGSNGTLNIIAGSDKFRGAADLCVGGALRTGCGIVRLISGERVVAAVAARHPSCTFLPIDENDNAVNTVSGVSGDTFLIGCGLGVSNRSSAMLFTALDASKKSVLDADALNILAQCKEYYVKLGGHIITPHVIEFSRLSGYSVTDIKSAPENCALNFAVKHGCVTVLKDAKTVIAVPNGRLYVSEGASEGLSKGGSGDVLAGLIAGFFAQDYSAEDAAVIGVATHALASQLCANEMGVRSMLPSELELYVAKLFASLGF